MPKKNKGWIAFIPYILVVLLMMSFAGSLFTGGAEDIGYKGLNEIIEKEQIEEIQLKVDGLTIRVSGKYKSGKVSKTFSTNIVNNTEAVKELTEKLDANKSIEDYQIINGTQTGWIGELLISIIPLILTIAMLSWLFTKMTGGSNGMRQQLDVVKSKARIQKNVKTKFTDVAGAEEEKEEVKELIDYLQNPKKFESMGARIPKGILLVGPPGTGKTLLARATAGEADVPFYSVSGSDFVELFVGAGAGRVRDMFKTAKETAPCIIFIDEIDAVGRQRGAGLGGGNDEREQTLNQLLVEMDGIEDNTGILIMAATNRADVLDPALLRPGRFDRQVQVSLPDRKGREAILEVHARNKKLADEASLSAIAQRTPGFSGADLENVLNEAAILAVRENKNVIELKELDEAIDRVMMGPAKASRTYNDEEKRRIAYHEAGHAVIGLNLEHANQVKKITIIPRGNAGGYNLMLPQEETFTKTKKQYLAEISSYLGGRVAEEIMFGDISDGAYGDIKSLTQIARVMVVQLGMSDLGPIQFQDVSQDVFLGRDYGSGQSFSNETAAKIDAEVSRIVDEAYELTKSIINDNKDQLDLIAQTLIEQETITEEEIKNIAARRPLDYVETNEDNLEENKENE